MPLTTAHAAAAWPLARLAPVLPTAALVIGTLSPDFIYLLRLAPGGNFGHTLSGLFLFCLPTSLVAWAVFEGLVRRPLCALLPPGVETVLAGGAPAPWRPRTIALAGVATVLGALTHVVWDAFTHANGWGVARVPALMAPVVAGSGLRWYRLLQYGCTALGTLATIAWAALAVARVPAEGRRFPPGQAARAARTVTALLLAAVAAGALNGLRARHHGSVSRLGYAAVGTMVGLAIALLVLGLVARARANRPPKG